MTELRVAAPAKLNLYLHVTGKRPDGYHLLDGLVAFADIHDTLTIAPAPSLSFSADGPFAGHMQIQVQLGRSGQGHGLKRHLN